MKNLILGLILVFPLLSRAEDPGSILVNPSFSIYAEYALKKFLIKTMEKEVDSSLAIFKADITMGKYSETWAHFYDVNLVAIPREGDTVNCSGSSMLRLFEVDGEKVWEVVEEKFFLRCGSVN